MIRMMIMAGGTGGHVYPALAVATELCRRGVQISWVGTRDSFESRVVSSTKIPFDTIDIKGLRKSGLVRKLVMPLLLLLAMIQVKSVIRKRKPNVVIGMGGFVSGPGGLVAAALRLPLVLHEQNAVAGLTNKWLARVSNITLSGFPEARGIKQFRWVGNPVRSSISAVAEPSARFAGRAGPLKILVIGGSRGAAVFNQNLPELLASVNQPKFEIWHQCGSNNSGLVEHAYSEAGLNARVSEFIDDMAEAYSWSDIVICRSGAMTVTEVCNAGAVAIFVPYPHAVNDHQARNADYLAASQAALMFREQLFIEGKWLDLLKLLGRDRARLLSMAEAARALAKPDAAGVVADVCMEAAHA